VHFGRLLAICLHFDALKVIRAAISRPELPKNGAMRVLDPDASTRLKDAFLTQCNH